MTLSVCCFTDAPPDRLSALLEPLHEVADEIVVGADSRLDASVLAAYESMADRVLRCEFDLLEHHLAWLHEQCSGDWILRLDSDEQASPELIAVLPDLVADRALRQYWFPRRWVDPSGYGWYDELPWSPDYHNRLVRNEPALSFASVLHSEADPAFPAAYRPEPIYHLLCELETREQRLAHSLRYEIRQPHTLAPSRRTVKRDFLPPRAFRSPAA